MASSASRTTVIVPAFNRADFLAETLESALSQTLPPLQIVVIDDASSDDTARVAEQFPVTLIRHATNRGLSEARNTGIAEAQGEFVAFLDSDDLWTTDHLECTTELLDSYPGAGLAFTGTVSFGERTALRATVLTPFTPGECYWELINGCFVPIQSVVVRRSVFAAAGVFESGRRIVEDYEWFFRLARHTQFVASDRVTAKYRIHPGQLSKSVRGMIFGNWEVLLRERARMASGPNAAADLDRFDTITTRRVSDDLGNLIYEGDYRSVQALAALLRTHGARRQADEIRSTDVARAVGRAMIHALPPAAANRLRALRRVVSSESALRDQS